MRFAVSAPRRRCATRLLCSVLAGRGGERQAGRRPRMRQISAVQAGEGPRLHLSARPRTIYAPTMTFFTRNSQGFRRPRVSGPTRRQSTDVAVVDGEFDCGVEVLRQGLEILDQLVPVGNGALQRGLRMRPSSARGLRSKWRIGASTRALLWNRLCCYRIWTDCATFCSQPFLRVNLTWRRSVLHGSDRPSWRFWRSIWPSDTDTP